MHSKIHKKYLLGFLVTISLLAIACGTSSSFLASSDLQSGEIKLSQFRFVAIYKSEYASFMELDLERLFEERGFEVVGREDIAHPEQTLWVRYTERGNNARRSIVVTLESGATDKTLLTVGCDGVDVSRKTLWKELAKRLDQVIEQFKE